MTHVRRPNRRRVPELAELINGGTCRASGKVRFLDERTAMIARDLTAKRDPDPARAATLGAYVCTACGDWHIGHG